MDLPNRGIVVCGRVLMMSIMALINGVWVGRVRLRLNPYPTLSAVDWIVSSANDQMFFLSAYYKPNFILSTFLPPNQMHRSLQSNAFKKLLQC
ncbi:hypothetical protein Ahy_A04g018109 isoform B [Arachis hypogaea]|uniref:Uncharacterized protein n=1 Tax=Arachis hypogaea TaxID=3818 RepID=A0A445DCV7_ARAHY|nr:hypothetical protein Ahy_A04g018109 isoform B [Arachis hypogaea]